MSLASRLLVVLLLPIALCFSVFGFSTVRLRRQLMTAEAEQEIRDHGTALQVAFDAFLRDRDLTDVSQLTEDLSRTDRILGVLVFDSADGLVEASRSVTDYRDELVPIARQARLAGHGQQALYRFHNRPVLAYAFPLGARTGTAGPRAVAVLLRDLRYIEDNLVDFERQIATVGLGVMCVVALGTWLAMRGLVSRPLAALARGAEQVAKGDLEVAIPIERRDEMGRLATAFNHMTLSLRQARNELESKQEANLALERRLQHAQRLALIGQLTASVAHQIGSPLNVILGRARYALKLGGQGERDRRHFQEIVVGGESISKVIERLLSQARRARGPIAAVDIWEIARDALRFLETECERQNIATSIVGDPQALVEGRRDEFEQLILNLCLNAIQALPAGGQLALSVRRVEGVGRSNIELEVADSGPGVPRSLRERIFEPFFTTKPAGEGTGLGLAICEEIVRQNGGTILVTDAKIGGASFRINLPSCAIRTLTIVRQGKVS